MNEITMLTNADPLIRMALAEDITSEETMRRSASTLKKRIVRSWEWASLSTAFRM